MDCNFKDLRFRGIIFIFRIAEMLIKTQKDQKMRMELRTAIDRVLNKSK
jgi:hypothetical protein